MKPQAFMKYIKKNNLEYSKIGNNRFFTEEQYNKFLDTTKCSNYTDEETTGTSEVQFQTMKNPSQFVNLQGREQKKRLSKSFNR